MLAPRVFGDVSKGSALVLVILEFPFDTLQDKVSPPGRRDDTLPADSSSSTAAKMAADLRPSADGSAVHMSLVAGDG